MTSDRNREWWLAHWLLEHMKQPPLCEFDIRHMILGALKAGFRAGWESREQFDNRQLEEMLKEEAK